MRAHSRVKKLAGGVFALCLCLAMLANLPARVTAEQRVLIDGLVSITGMADVKTWTCDLPAGMEYELDVGVCSPGIFPLRFQAVSPNVTFTVFSANLTQKNTEGADSWTFATPVAGPYVFSLILLAPIDMAITVAVHLTEKGPVTNSWVTAAGLDHTPVFNTSIFSTDQGGAERDFNMSMRANTTYNFAVALLTPFDPGYAQTNAVAVWADCANLSGEPDYGVCYGGQLVNKPLDWHATWWGVPDNGTYVLHVKITSDGTFRVGIGITVTESSTFGNASAGDNSTPGTSIDELFQNPVFLTLLVGGAALIIVPALVASRRRRGVQTGVVQRGYPL